MPTTNINFDRELWQTAVNLRGTVAPAEYKSYVLPLLFMRYLSLRYEQRRVQLTLELKNRRSPYYTSDATMDDVIVLGEDINLHQTDEWIADLVRQVVKAVRENLAVDWTKPHCNNIEAAVQSAVGRVLLKSKIKASNSPFSAPA